MKKILMLADINSSHTKKWATGLSEKGFKIILFGLTTPTSLDFYKDYPDIQLETAGFSRSRFDKTDGHFTKIFHLTSIFKLKNLIKRERPDYIHAHYATSYGLLARLTSKRYYISVWGSDVFLFPRKSFFHQFALSFILNKAALIFSTSKVMKDETRKYTNRPIQVIPFGISTEKFYSGREIFSEKPITIGSLKNLESIYGHDVLLHAFKKLKEEIPETPLHLILVGDGTKKEELTVLAQKLGITQQFEVICSAKTKEIPELINRFDIAVFLSRSESFGVAVIECSACERPVITTKVGGLVEVVKHNETGLFVSKDSVEETVEALKLLINNQEWAKRLGKNGRKFVAHEYQWEQNLKTQIEFYS